MVQKLNEATDPHDQRFFVESYLETGMRPQGLAGVGFCVSPIQIPLWSMWWIRIIYFPKSNHSMQQRRTGLISILSAFLFLVLIGSGCSEQSTNQIEPIKEVKEKETQQVVDIQQPDVAVQQPDDGTVLVTRVIDGDTIEIEGGKRVRYIGIDTPETVDPRKPVQCFGIEANKRNKELVDGKRVRLEKDVTDTDRYNRLLRYVYVGDTFVNLALVQEGYANSYTYPPDVKYQDQFVTAQQTAREQKKGLWSACQTVPPPPPVTIEQPPPPPVVPPPPPVTIEQPPPPPVVPPPPPSTQTQTPPPTASNCTIKGNITTEKIYHLPGCGSYDKTQIDEARGERWFCSESEAVAAGWRKAKNCP